MSPCGVWTATVRRFAAVAALLAACGKDPILAEAEKAGGAQGTAGADNPPAPAGDGAPRRANVGDPQPGTPAEPTPGTPGTPTPGAPGTPAPGVPGSPTPGVAGAPGAGVPAEPPPGIPEEPKPGLPGAPQPITGPSVTISGEVEYPDYTRGKVRVTAFDGAHAKHGATPPKVVGSVEVDRPGPFEIVVPQNAGKVYVEAVVDEDEDGRPGPQDPAGQADRYPVTAAERPITGLTVELTKRPPPPAGAKEDF